MTRYRKKRKDVYFATYTGKHTDIKVSGIGRVYIGKEFEVQDKKIYFALKNDPNFSTRIGYVYK
jgi:hypothetical protein